MAHWYHFRLFSCILVYATFFPLYFRLHRIIFSFPPIFFPFFSFTQNYFFVSADFFCFFRLLRIIFFRFRHFFSRFFVYAELFFRFRLFFTVFSFTQNCFFRFRRFLSHFSFTQNYFLRFRHFFPFFRLLRIIFRFRRFFSRFSFTQNYFVRFRRFFSFFHLHRIIFLLPLIFFPFFRLRKFFFLAYSNFFICLFKLFPTLSNFFLYIFKAFFSCFFIIFILLSSLIFIYRPVSLFNYCLWTCNMDRLTKELLIEEYFRKDYKYREIQELLSLKGCNISLVQIKRILRERGLSRRTRYSSYEEVIDAIFSIINGPFQHCGYRFIHDTLKSMGIKIPRRVVMCALKMIDPVGVDIRKRGKLIRRRYYAKGPNWAWHVDSYDKLKPYGICINGCIDGFSRKIIWMEAYNTNSDPRIIGQYYLEAVQLIQGCPNILRVDAGTENVNIIGMQRFLHEDENNGESVVIGSSHSNIKIESWWAQYRKHQSEFYVSMFHGLKSEGLFCGDNLDIQLVQFCFMNIIQVII